MLVMAIARELVSDAMDCMIGQSAQMRRIPPFAGVELAVGRILQLRCEGRRTPFRPRLFVIQGASEGSSQFLIRFFSVVRMTNAVIYSVT